MNIPIDSDFIFKPLREIDLDQIKIWLQEPHVKEFYDLDKNWDDVSRKIKQRISSDLVKQVIVFVRKTRSFRGGMDRTKGSPQFLFQKQKFCRTVNKQFSF